MSHLLLAIVVAGGLSLGLTSLAPAQGWTPLLAQAMGKKCHTPSTSCELPELRPINSVCNCDNEIGHVQGPQTAPQPRPTQEKRPPPRQQRKGKPPQETPAPAPSQ